jgi:hypothetical protein
MKKLIYLRSFCRLCWLSKSNPKTSLYKQKRRLPRQMGADTPCRITISGSKIPLILPFVDRMRFQIASIGIV